MTVKGKQIEPGNTPTNYTATSTNLDGDLAGIDAKLGELIAAGRVGDIIVIEDQKATGTDGGTASSGGWKTRDLNTIVADTGGHASISANQITLAAGAYTAIIHCPSMQTDNHTARLQNITDASTIATGSTQFLASSASGTTVSIVQTRFVLATSKTLEVQHQFQTTRVGDGLGNASAFAAVEVYTQVILLREADSDGGAGSTQIPMDYALIEDQKASGTDGGTFTSGAWRTRDLNTEVADTGGNVSIASNQITLAAGTYIIKAFASAVAVDRHNTRLQNITSGTTLLSGDSAFVTSSASVNGFSTIFGTFTLSAQSVLEIQHQCQTTQASQGFGIASGFTFTVDHETYTRVELWKIPETATAGPGLPRGYIDGLILSNNTTDALHDIDISVGETRDSSNAQDISLSASFTKQIDAAWAEGTGLGGFPSTLTLTADTWYHVFLIFNRAAGKTDAGFDTSITAANLLADNGYTHYRRLGSVLTNASSEIIAFSQVGDEFVWSTPPLDVNATITTGALFTVSVPLGVNTLSRLNVNIRPTVASGTGGVYLSSPNSNDIVGSFSVSPLLTAGISISGGLDVTISSQGLVMVNTSSQIRARAASDVSQLLKLATIGYQDPRGKDV